LFSFTSKGPCHVLHLLVLVAALIADHERRGSSIEGPDCGRCGKCSRAVLEPLVHHDGPSARVVSEWIAGAGGHRLALRGLAAGPVSTGVVHCLCDGILHSWLLCLAEREQSEGALPICFHGRTAAANKRSWQTGTFGWDRRRTGNLGRNART